MAFRFDSSDEYGDLAEINVTPLVDVMLVLLIIFMITAPMLTQGLTVALPSAEGKSFEMASSQPSKIQVTAAGGGRRLPRRRADGECESRIDARTAAAAVAHQARPARSRQGRAVRAGGGGVGRDEPRGGGAARHGDAAQGGDEWTTASVTCWRSAPR